MMINFVFIIALLYILVLDMKLMRYSAESFKNKLGRLGYGFIALIAFFYLRTVPLGPYSSTYIRLLYGLSPMLIIITSLMLVVLVLKCRKELMQTTWQLIRHKWNIIELTVLTALLIATAVDKSLWSFIGTFAIAAVLIAREAFFLALKRNNETEA